MGTVRTQPRIAKVEKDCQGSFTGELWPRGSIDGWYNPRRIQAGLGGLSPDEYEQAYPQDPKDR